MGLPNLPREIVAITVSKHLKDDQETAREDIGQKHLSISVTNARHDLCICMNSTHDLRHSRSSMLSLGMLHFICHTNAIHTCCAYLQSGCLMPVHGDIPDDQDWVAHLERHAEVIVFQSWRVLLLCLI